MSKRQARLTWTVLALFGAVTAPARAFVGFEGGREAATYPESSNGAATPTPAIEAHRLNGEGIRLDGRLDDSAWTQAESGSGFRVSDPDRGAKPSEETVFKVAYDEDAVYFGVACLEADPSKIAAKLSRRDRSSSSDLVSVYIDPYRDHTTGYNFKVNPLGVQQDGYIYNDGDRDDDWDAVWEARTSRDDRGWYAEMRIPFSAIRYRAAPSMTWGLQVYRYMHGRGEDTAWVIWEREKSGFVSRFGELRGIEGVRAPRQLE
ncbi:MAG TPA: carbohydrate binding family 9 domain-containing protein, partial [Candidatus Eisenbacteria bacterium]